MAESSNRPCSIVKIIKATHHSVSTTEDGEEKVLVKFLALNTEGEKVIVDNNQLKVEHPQLLCAFYEQFLRYDFDQPATKK